ncbi:unnamed protein product, partial [Mesorhabditis spiculigera]
MFLSTLIMVPIIITVFLYIRIVCFISKTYTVLNTMNVGKEKSESTSKLVNTALVIVISFLFGYGVFSIFSPLVCKYDCPFEMDYNNSLMVMIGFFQADLVVLKLVANPFIYTLRMGCFREGIRALARHFHIKVFKEARRCRPLIAYELELR